MTTTIVTDNNLINYISAVTWLSIITTKAGTWSRVTDGASLLDGLELLLHDSNHVDEYFHVNIDTLFDSVFGNISQFYHMNLIGL